MDVYVCHYTPNIDRRLYLQAQGIEARFITDYDRETLDVKQIESWNHYQEASNVFSRIAPTLLANIICLNQNTANFRGAFASASRFLDNGNDRERFLSGLVKPLTPSETSLFYKHLMAMKYIAESSRAYGVVIEDDCIFPHDAISSIKAILSKYGHLYDYIDLAGGAGLTPARTDQCFDAGCGRKLYTVIPPRTRTTCAFSISRRFAKLLVTHLTNPIAPIDHMLTYLAQEFAMDVAWCEPPPLVHGSEVGAYRSNLR